MTAVGITTHSLGLAMMEAMARPLNQWHHEPSGAAPQGSYPEFRSALDDRRFPRMSTPPNFPLRLPLPQPTPTVQSRRQSVQSNNDNNSPSPLERPSPTTGLAGYHDSSHHLFSRPGYYDIRRSPSQPLPSAPSNIDTTSPSLTRPRQLSEALPIPSHYVSGKALPLASLPSSVQSGGAYFPKPATPRLSQSPRPSLSSTPGSSLATSPRQDQPRNMAVRSLLNNDEGASVSPASSTTPTRGHISLARPDDAKYELSLRQQPLNARSCGFGDRDRRVIDPPPIVQLKVTSSSGLSHEEVEQRMKSPLNIVHCSVWSEDGAEEMSGMPDDYTRQKRLMGNLVASPFWGQDENGEEGCFFCFPDISCRTPGKYRLKFSLVAVNARPGTRSPVKVEVLSDVFQTFSAKEFPGMSESTALAKALKSQGCNIPTKKGNDKPGGGKRDDSDDYSDDEDSPRKKRVRTNNNNNKNNQ